MGFSYLGVLEDEGIGVIVPDGDKWVSVTLVFLRMRRWV